MTRIVWRSTVDAKHDFLESQHRDEIELTLVTQHLPNIRLMVAGKAAVSLTEVGKVECTYPHAVAGPRSRRSADARRTGALITFRGPSGPLLSGTRCDRKTSSRAVRRGGNGQADAQFPLGLRRP